MSHEIIIGLGGLGGRSIQEFRRTIVQRRQDYDFLVTSGTQLNYLYIDSSDEVLRDNQWSACGKNIALHAHQVIQLKPRVGHPDIEEIINHPNIAPWIGDIQEALRKRTHTDDKTASKLLQTLEGTGQLRRYGRALFAWNATAIRHALKNKIASSPDPTKNFRIFCSPGGGTGSGCLIDMITLISTLAKEFRIAANITVYAYVGGINAHDINVGTFFENQYCTLRDLNALIVGAYHPLVTGMPIAEPFHGSPNISHIYLSSDIADERPRLDKQIDKMVSSCFDCILYGHTFNSPGCLRAIEVNDLANITPGETGTDDRIARSYRFATIGTHRWHVPTTQIRQLLTCDTEKRVWNKILKGTPLPDGIYRNVSKIKGFDFSLSSLEDEFNHILDEALSPVTDIVKTAKIRKRKDYAVLRDITDAAKNAVVRVHSLASDKSTKARLSHQSHELVKNLEKELLQAIDKTIAWDSGNPEVWGLEDVHSFLNAYRDVVYYWPKQLAPAAATNEVEKTDQMLRELMELREAEWSKIGPMSALCTSITNRMIDAHAKNAHAIVVNAFSAFKYSYLQEVTDRAHKMLTYLDNALHKLIDYINYAQYETDYQGNNLWRELRNQENSRSYSDICELDINNLEQMRHEMAHREEPFTVSMADIMNMLRKTAGNGESFIFCNRKNFELFTHEMRTSILNNLVESLHDTARESTKLNSVLDTGILEYLEVLGGQIGNNNWHNHLQSKLHQLMWQVPFSLEIHPNNGLTTPLPAPAMATIIGIPRHPGNPGFVNMIQNMLRSMIHPSTYVDFYEHHTQEEIRVLYIPHWFPCRFATVVNELEARYRERLEKNETAIIFFTNCDESGMDNSPQFNRPSLTGWGE